MQKKEKPILFSGPMVQAILGGRKTQTRRVVKPQPKSDDIDNLGDGSTIIFDGLNVPCPYGEIRDRLWVRETFLIDHYQYISGPLPKSKPDDIEGLIYYRADGECCEQIGECQCEGKTKWKPSIFCTRWASRITLEITSIRVERLQDVSEDDAKAEGCIAEPWGAWWQGYTNLKGQLVHQTVQGDTPPDWMIEPHKMERPHLDKTAKHQFQSLWHSINGPESWTSNPWVWVIEFKRI